MWFQDERVKKRVWTLNNSVWSKEIRVIYRTQCRFYHHLYFNWFILILYLVCLLLFFLKKLDNETPEKNIKSTVVNFKSKLWHDTHVEENYCKHEKWNNFITNKAPRIRAIKLYFLWKYIWEYISADVSLQNTRERGVDLCEIIVNET